MPGEEVWAVLPIKAFDCAKQRLAKRFDPAFRRGLAATMAADVLDALSGARLAGILVVTADAAARALATEYGAEICDRAGVNGGHTAAVLAGARMLLERGVGAMLALPGDIPGITPDEIAAVLAGHGAAPSFSIVPSHDGRGSNAILASPPDAVPLAYGDDSFLPHLAAARARGIEPRVLQLDGIGLDVDHPADLAALTARDWNTRTHRLLAAEMALS